MVFVNQDNGLLAEPVHDLIVFQVGDHLLEDKEDVTAADCWRLNLLLSWWWLYSSGPATHTFLNVATWRNKVLKLYEWNNPSTYVLADPAELLSGQVKFESHGEALDTPAAVVDVVEASFCGGEYKQWVHHPAG